MTRTGTIFALFLVVLFTVYITQPVTGQSIPKCITNGISMNVSEQEPTDFVVYRLKCTDDDETDTLTYWLNPNGNTYKKFRVTQEGEIRLAKTLNADFTYKYNLHVTVTDSSASHLSTTVLIGILVLNINDNDPVIKDLQSVLNIREDTKIGTKISTCSVNDKDYKQNALAGQTRVGIKNPYSPGARRWVIDSETCNFYVNTLLDYENKKQYSIALIAYDLDPIHPRTVTQTLTIKVIDVNDNYPKCTEHYQIIGVPEDVTNGSTIVSLVCSDKDSNDNGKVYFKISDDNSDTIKDTFTMTPISGELQIVHYLDYEIYPFYDINIDVYDGGVPSLTATIIVGVVLSDVDDNIPTWPVDPLTNTVIETTPLGTVVFVVNAEDIDAPNTPASTIKYGLVSQPDPDWFAVDPDTGGVYVTGIMNWLIASSIRIEVLAYSSDKTNDYNVVTINITLTDENNVAPSFMQLNYHGNVSEDDPIGTYILTVKASDPENGLNGEVGYNISSSYFQVDPDTGVVSLKNMVDFETNIVFSMNVEAHDKGSPVQRGYTYLIINVMPVNEFTPIISQVHGPINIPENTEPATILNYFSVVDDDIGFDGSITYFLDNPLLPFTVEPKTGIFRVGSMLDRENIPQWEIIVIAKDASESNPKSSSTTVTVILDDVNDNNPLCEPLTNTIVKLPHQVGKLLSTIKCSDDDIGTNAAFSYTKVSGDEKDSFTVNDITGDITLAKKPTDTKYTLTILVEDRGDPKLDVIIAFNIIAELQFNFSNIPTVVHVPENTDLAVELYDIDACCVFSFIDYEMVSGNDANHVILDPSSGKLILMNSFDRETKTSYRYDIKAISFDTNSTAESYIDIVIDDSNDNIPRFDTTFQYISVSEDLPEATSITQITASDMDEGTNSQIVYSITDGNIDTTFEIDSIGNIMLISGLDAESVKQYALIITATDKGDVPLTGTATMVIDVKNVNEFSPQIVNINDGVIYTNVSEDETLGAPIFALRAEDRDIDTVFTYNIVLGNEEQAFVIDGSSGDIYLAKILDRETTDQYNITAEVETGDGEKVLAVVVMQVLDVNDNDPKFAQDVYQLEVTHEDPSNKFITTFIITDNDVGINQDIASIIITDGDPGNHFKIVGNEIQTNVQVDYYIQKIYSLTVQATDAGVPARSSFARVVINVHPKFKPPRFLSNNYTVTVREDASSSDDVFDMDATADGGLEGNFGTIKYSIRNGNDKNDLYISDTTGIIRVTSRLDFEDIESYMLLIDAESRENPLLSSSSTLTILVENINDNVPLFSLAVYTWNIDEDASPGDEVGSVSASDGDKAPYGTITYSLGTSTGSSDFSIDTNGVIRVATSLNYRARNFYSIPVIADDGGIINGNAAVIIRINDVNDNPPTFASDNVTVDVVEGISDITFYTVKAEDLDAGLNGQIKYTFVSGNSDNHLGLDAVTGALTVLTSLDRETITQFDLVIRAVDQALTGRKSGTLYLTVNVADINDQDPNFSKTLEDLTINRSVAPGFSIVTVSATDDDVGNNAVVSYEITSGNSDGLFLIGVNSGEIKTASDVESSANEYSLVITAKDNGVPVRSATMTVNIQIRPFQVSGPSEQSMQIQEELAAGQQLSNVTPKSGHDPAATIKYAIGSGNFQTAFAINEDTGLISTLKLLDREVYPSYILSIDVSDDNGVAYTKSVSVDILDINDNNPIITTTDTDINVVENTPAGHIVTGFTVTDKDSGVNSETDLSISPIPAAAGEYFEIRGRFLMVKSQIDFETIQVFSFQVLAVDRGNPKLSSSVGVTINVIDVNDSERVVQGNGEAPSVYISTETSYKAANREAVITLSGDDFGIYPSTGTVKFTSLNREGIFVVDEQGKTTVHKPELLEAELIYFVWIVAVSEDADNRSSVLGLLRVDTFDPNKHLVAIESDIDTATLGAFRDEMTDNLKSYFPQIDVPKIWKIIPYGTISRRKLLVASSEALVYVIEGPVSHDIADIEVPKKFKSMIDMLNILRLVPNQDTPHPLLETPNFPVVAVNGYYIPDPPTTGGTISRKTTFTSSTDGYITFGLLGLLLLLILLILIIFYCYKKKKREKRRQNDSADSLVPVESKKHQRKVDMQKPKGMGKRTPPVFGDIPTNKTTRRTSQGSIDDLLPGTSFSPILDSSTRNASQIDMDTSIVSGITPVQTTAKPHAALSPIPTAMPAYDAGKRGEKLKPLEKRTVLHAPKVQDERTPSIIDLSNVDDQTDNSAGVGKRKDGPVVYRGKEYDGVAYDAEKQQRYAYNTRTGSTLWEDKDNNMGKGKAAISGKKKKKSTPMLTVVSEAKRDYSPNLNLNRSVGVISTTPDE